MRRLALALLLAALPALGQTSGGLSTVACPLSGCASSGGGSGTVTTTGSPESGQVALISGATSITGDSGCTWTGTGANFTLVVPYAVRTNAVSATVPATGASTVAGNNVEITASDAQPGDTNPGAAVGGELVFSSGSADRLTSGNANGGRIRLIPGLGIGTGTAGYVDVQGALTGTGTMTIPDLSFSGTTTTGLHLKSLTTTQRDAVSPAAAAGDMVYNSTTGRVEVYDGAAWHGRVRLDGDTMTGALLAPKAVFAGTLGAPGLADTSGVVGINAVAGGLYGAENGHYLWQIDSSGFHIFDKTAAGNHWVTLNASSSDELQVANQNGTGGAGMIHLRGMRGTSDTTALTESSATAFASLTFGASVAVSAEFFCRIQANDATDFQSLTSRVRVSSVRKATGNTVSAVGVVGTDLLAESAGGSTLSCTFTATEGASAVTLNANCVSSLTQTTFTISFMATTVGAVTVAKL